LLRVDRDRIKFVNVVNDPADPLVESDNPTERRKQQQHLTKQRSNNNGTALSRNIHMKVKLLKTQLLQYVPEVFEYVLYVDR
jgi:hypothetical protein